MVGYIRAAGEFVIVIHLFACGWLYVGGFENEWMTEDQLEYENMTLLYVNSLHFVAQTMTSVGYGDTPVFG